VKRLPSPVGQQAKESNRRETRVQVEVDFLLAARLAVGQAGVLFGISDYKFDLVTKPIVPGNLFGWLGGVGRTKHHVILRSKQKHHTKIALEVRAVGHGRKNANFWSPRKTANFLKPSFELLAVVPVDFSVVLPFWPSRPGRRTGVEISQIGVCAKPRNQMEPISSMAANILFFA